MWLGFEPTGEKPSRNEERAERDAECKRDEAKGLHLGGRFVLREFDNDTIGRGDIRIAEA